MFQDYLNVPFDALLEHGGVRVVWIKGLERVLRSQFRRSYLPVRHHVLISQFTLVLNLDVDCLRVVENEAKSTTVANLTGLFLWIREEAFIELVGRPVLLGIAQMLCKSDFEH